MVDVSVLALQAVGGFTVGALIGYVVKKLARWALIAVGFMLLPIFVLWYVGVLYVNWGYVNELVGRFATWLGVTTSDMMSSLASMGLFGFSTVFGFVFGLTSGFKDTVLPVDNSNAYKFVRRKKERCE